MSSVWRGSGVSKGIWLALMLVLALPLGSQPVEARAGVGLSFGSRGARTFSMPAATATAPRGAQPLQRTDTQRVDGTPGFGAGARPGGFGFGGGLLAGLLGAGLFGLFAGQSFGGGFAFLLQIALIGGVIWLALRVFRGRMSGPAFAGSGPGSVRRGTFGSGGLPGGAGSPPPASLPIGPADYAAFERALHDIQAAYGREDFNALSRLTTPEMLRSFGAEIERNRSRGLRNEVTDARLLQGDLAEAWREGATHYASVAMRFSIRDLMVERASGRVVSGDASGPTEATELWTFRREGGPWLLSAIQQTG